MNLKTMLAAFTAAVLFSITVSAQTALTQFTLTSTTADASAGTDLGGTAISVHNLDTLTVWIKCRSLDTSNGWVNFTFAGSHDGTTYTVADGTLYVPVYCYGSNYVTFKKDLDLTGINYIKPSIATNAIGAGVSNIVMWYSHKKK